MKEEKRGQIFMERGRKMRERRKSKKKGSMEMKKSQQVSHGGMGREGKPKNG